MTAPSPLHRDPETDGDDYGCFTKKANHAVARMVEHTIEKIESGELTTNEEIIDHVRPLLETQRKAGATDTTVKENVFHALGQAIQEQKIPFEWMSIYGW